jgi:hypothetical protein
MGLKASAWKKTAENQMVTLSKHQFGGIAWHSILQSTSKDR